MGTIARSTDYGEPFYDYRDTFTWNGKRLVKVSGATFSENGEYRPEIEDGSFTRLVLAGAENGGVWTVHDSSGRRTVYGETAGERIYRPDNNTRTYTWHFSRTVDINDNSMYAIYDQSEHDIHHVLYLKEIRYTANDSMGQSAKQFVRFTLKNRSDFYVSKAGGFIMKMDKLLDTIEVGKIGLIYDSTLWSYRLVYETSADSNRPLLVTVQ
jgi:hypothetical protein